MVLELAPPLREPRLVRPATKWLPKLLRCEPRLIVLCRQVTRTHDLPCKNIEVRGGVDVRLMELAPPLREPRLVRPAVELLTTYWSESTLSSC